jgi:superfamily II DNA or RNA helicase
MDVNMDMEIDEVEGFLYELQDDDDQEEESQEIADSQGPRELDHVYIAPPKRFNRKSYRVFVGEERVVKVVEEHDEDEDQLEYTVRFGDTRHERVSLASVFSHERISGRTWSCDTTRSGHICLFHSTIFHLYHRLAFLYHLTTLQALSIQTGRSAPSSPSTMRLHLTFKSLIVTLQIPIGKLLELENGESALNTYQKGQNSAESGDEASDSDTYGMTRQTRGSRRQSAVYDNEIIQLSTDDDSEDSESGDVIMSGLRSGKQQLKARPKRRQTYDDDDDDDDDGEISDEDEPRRSRRSAASNGRRNKVTKGRLSTIRNQLRVSTRSSRNSRSRQDSEDEDDEISDEDDEHDILRSDLPGHQRKRRGIGSLQIRSNKRQKAFHEPTRRSERSTRAAGDMGEIDINDIYRSDSDREKRAVAPPKATGARETFIPRPRGDKFRERHPTFCDTCRNSNASSGQMIYCQGCTLSYHRTCLGPRGQREHLVTKVGDEDFVLQCRRCVNTPQKKDPYAPDLARCQDCRKKGPSCVPFRTRKTALQEQKEREENGGEDPIYNVPDHLLNKTENVLFRCIDCSRASHFHHLESRNQYALAFDDETERADARFSEYSKDWKCKECAEMPGKVGGIVAWRPVDVESYQPTLDVSTIEEDEKEYLIKWQDFSYFRAQWMPGAWVWGVLSHSRKSAFFKRYPPPKMRTEDAIPEEWLRIDIVLDVKYTNKIDFHSMDVDKARIKEVGTALLKYKGLGYEDAVWEEVPSPDDGDRWTDFVTAYDDWVLGRYTALPGSTHLKDRIAKLKAKKFEAKEAQPTNLEGGELMKYQLEGLNWLYYQWFAQKNGILADEMGLGKTIQIISFIAMMVQDIKCYPFLVVVPNSTCPNWRREIKQWAPSLRVVTYYGSATAREMAHKYELFPNGSKTIRCHVVITSYEAATDEPSRKLLRSVPWQGLIVDEGQRLKNDQSLLHNALNALKVPFRILLTGTPLQNNARELFNLLQFLDDTINAEQMEREYEDMTNEKISRLHDLIRPFILRRTKLQVLSFLPPMAQIILPVSMSHLQKKTYRSILEQKPDLLRSLLSQGSLKASERVGLNNILMQLRKCLCHPFVFNKDIEERGLEQRITHTNLVEASAKLQLLELLLPKLQQRGHRVLIFSQFLDMLDITEDFLDGMGMLYQRLDGTISALEKQKRIDEFNAPASPLFAFLLSTRAGGVGINLATADTVIILDPDFNPHQDIQAISRAHRIGQTRKVLCFQLMTRASAEEKIMQVGRKKMALDQVVIGQLDDEDMEDKDMESILKHGMVELFNDAKADAEIRYDDGSIEKLLDRSQIENTKSGKDNTAESQFSFARVWENDAAVLQDSLNVSEEEESAPNKGLWEKILKDREKKAAERAAKQELGRGKRQRQAVTYNERGSPVPAPEGEGTGEDKQPGTTPPFDELPIELQLLSTEKPRRKERAQGQEDADSDTDFHLSESEEESADEVEVDGMEPKEAQLLGPGAEYKASAPSGLAAPSATATANTSATLAGMPPPQPGSATFKVASPAVTRAVKKKAKKPGKFSPRLRTPHNKILTKIPQASTSSASPSHPLSPNCPPLGPGNRRSASPPVRPTPHPVSAPPARPSIPEAPARSSSLASNTATSVGWRTTGTGACARTSNPRPWCGLCSTSCG